MKEQIQKIQDSCPRREIAAYLDGDLSPSAEMDLEMHFSDCETCAAEFNEQKKLFNALDLALDEQHAIELPEDFTKSVVVKAESSVSGLRRPEERFLALFLCAGLFLLIVLGLGTETETTFATFAVAAEQIYAVAGLIAHLVFDIAIAFAAIVRLIGGKFIYNPVFAVLTLGVFLLSVGYIFSRILTSFDRSKNLETR